MLIHCRDGQNAVLQQNSAILLASMSRLNCDVLMRIRELHGLEILHDVVQHTNMTV